MQVFNMSLGKLVTAFLSLFCLPLSSSQELAQKVNQGCPEWMAEAIKRELTPFRNVTLSLKKMTEEFLNTPPEHNHCKISNLKTAFLSNNTFQEMSIEELRRIRISCGSHVAPFGCPI
jgi:hypothetical protein